MVITEYIAQSDKLTVAAYGLGPESEIFDAYPISVTYIQNDVLITKEEKYFYLLQLAIFF